MPGPDPFIDRRQFMLRVLRLGGAGVATVGLGALLSGRSREPVWQEARQLVCALHLRPGGRSRTILTR